MVDSRGARNRLPCRTSSGAAKEIRWNQQLNMLSYTGMPLHLRAPPLLQDLATRSHTRISVSSLAVTSSISWGWKQAASTMPLVERWATGGMSRGWCGHGRASLVPDRGGSLVIPRH